MVEPGDLVLELLRAMRSDMADQRQMLEEVLLRLSRIEMGQTNLRREQANDAEASAHVQAQLDKLRSEVATIKRRLDIVG